MSIDIEIAYNPTDPTYIFMRGRCHKLEEHLNKIPKYQLLPTFNGIPCPETFLYKFNKNGETLYYCSAGLWKEVLDWFKDHNVNVSHNLGKEFKYTQFNLTKEQFKEYVRGWGMNIEPRDYQLEAAWLILKYNTSLSELATRAGKTLIFTIVARAAKELLGCKKILMVVPSIHLVKQGVKDINEYKEYFNTEQIWADGQEVEMSDLTIGTFQSLVRRADKRYGKYNPEFFKDYDFVCIDEAHKCPCKSIQIILSLLKPKIKFGFTGTLPKPNTIESFACQALLGPCIQKIQAQELIEQGFLARPVITQERIFWSGYEDTMIECAEYLLSSYKKVDGKQVKLPEDQRKFTMIYEKDLPYSIRQAKQLYSKEEYLQHLLSLIKQSSKGLVLEQLTTMMSDERIGYISDMAYSKQGNGIIFAHHTEYINALYNELSDPNKEWNNLLGESWKKTIYKITGSTPLKKRQKILDEMLHNDNIILIGSFGVVSTGLTFKNVSWGLFAESFKSDIITKQSLGRLMLRTEDKQTFDLIDIIDVFPTKKLYNQGLEKIKTYKEEGHDYKTSKIYLEF